MSRAFTILELLVATAILVLLVALLLGIFSNTTKLWTSANQVKIRDQVARNALRAITSDLESAVFPIDSTNQNTWQYIVDPGLAEYENPHAFFWQAALPDASGVTDLFEVGYFVKWFKDARGVHCELRRLRASTTNSDSIVNKPKAWLTASKLTTYAPGSENTDGRGLLATDVLGLWITLYDHQGQSISLPYDSRQVPVGAIGRAAFVEITLAVADPITTAKLNDSTEITTHYSATDPASFVNQLPEKIKQAVGIYTTRASLKASESSQ